MTKKLSFLFTILSLFFLVSCITSYTADKLYNEIKIDFNENENEQNVLTNIRLNDKYGTYRIYWTSSNELVIDNQGIVTRQHIDTEVTLTASFNYEGEVHNKDFELIVKAKEVDIFTISFIVNDEIYKSFEVLNGDKILPFDNPVVSNSVFVGWYDIETNELFDINKVITTNKTYKAKFDSKVNVEFYLDNELLSSVELNYESLISVSDIPSFKDRIIEGWYLEDNSKFNFSNKIITNLKLHAKYELKEVKSITYFLDKETDVTYEVVDVYLDELTTEIPAPTKEGYIFKGWLDKSTDLAFDFNQVITENISLYASFEKEILTETTYRESFAVLEAEKEWNNFSEYIDFELTNTPLNWDIINGRIDLGMKDGKGTDTAITLRGQGNDLGEAGLGRIQSDNYTNGLSYLEFEARLPFSPNSTYPQGPGSDKASNVKISIMVNGNKIHTFQFKDDKEANKGEKFVLDNIDIIGDYNFSIDVSSGHRLTVTNIVFKSNKNGVAVEENRFVDFEDGSQRFDFAAEPTVQKLGNEEFILKEVHTLIMHNDKELAYMNEQNGNVVARFRGLGGNGIFNTPVAFMESVNYYDKIDTVSFLARLFGSNGYFGLDSRINIYVISESETDFRLVQSLELTSEFESYEVIVNEENVKIKIEVVGGSINLDNISF